MILADKIIDLRKKAGWSQEELSERLGVSRQSVSKWEGAQSVPDMNRILAMADVFGVTTDYLLRDDMEPADIRSAPVLPEAESEIPVRRVSMEDANAFLALRETVSGRIALGVMLCILSPVLLILLGGAGEYGLLPVAAEQASMLGLIVLFLMIAAAVALFVTSGAAQRPWEYMENQWIETEYGVSGMARDRLERYQPTYVRMLTGGIVLCILSLIPLFVTAAMHTEEAMEDGDIILVAAVAMIFVLAAIGVMMIVKSAMTRSSFLMLLEEGDYSRAAKTENRKNASISAAYWGVILVVYLLWSFLSGNWGMTWIIWCVSGILYGVLRAILRIVRKES